MTFLTLNKKKQTTSWSAAVIRSTSYSDYPSFYEVALTGLISSTASSIPVFALMYIR